MRLDEFYSPEEDNKDKLKQTDTRKTRLTLEQLNKLRKVRDMKETEEVEHQKFVRKMYSAPAQPATI
jgi:hypothetical protein